MGQGGEVFWREGGMIGQSFEVRSTLAMRRATPLRKHREEFMNRRVALGLPTTVLAGVALSACDAMAQQSSLKEELVGTWTMVLCEAVQQDGTKGPLVMGSDPAGQYIFTANGHF